VRSLEQERDQRPAGWIGEGSPRSRRHPLLYNRV